MRLAAGLEYDGSRFLGWQVQAREPTVQACVERALSRVADHRVSITASGRTDAGVHALEQVFHFDSNAERGERSWVLGLNSHLPEGVSGLWTRPVDDDFHARFSAYSRRYRYVILNRQVRPALDAGRAAWCREPLDAERMNRAAQALRGEHDFTSFRASGCQARHPVREVHDVSVRRHGNFVLLDIEANAFLYRMVRNIAGSLMAVGSGEKPPAWVAQALEARDRDAAGITAPAEGLYFVKARYPKKYRLPGRIRAFPFALSSR